MCMYTNVCVYMYTCVYMCVYVCMCAHMCMYIVRENKGIYRQSSVFMGSWLQDPAQILKSKDEVL